MASCSDITVQRQIEQQTHIDYHRNRRRANLRARPALASVQVTANEQAIVIIFQLKRKVLIAFNFSASIKIF
jgi:hypothetical protein